LYIQDAKYIDYTLGLEVFNFYVKMVVEQKTNHFFHGYYFITFFINRFPDPPRKAVAAVTSADRSVSVEQGTVSSQAEKKRLFSSIIQFTLVSFGNGEPIFFDSFSFSCLFCFQSSSINSTLFHSTCSAQLELHK